MYVSRDKGPAAQPPGRESASEPEPEPDPEPELAFGGLITAATVSDNSSVHSESESSDPTAELEERRLMLEYATAQVPQQLLEVRSSFAVSSYIFFSNCELHTASRSHRALRSSYSTMVR